MSTQEQNTPAKQKRKSDWIRVTVKAPENGVYVLIKTVTGCVRVAKRIVYNNGEVQYTYSSIKFNNVMWWKPLPR